MYNDIKAGLSRNLAARDLGLGVGGVPQRQLRKYVDSDTARYHLRGRR